jgi:predicted extracellular nuclease
MDEPETPVRKQQRGLKSVLPYTTVAMIIAALYAGWTLYSRHEANVKAVADIQAKKAQAEKDSYDAATQHGELAFTTFETRSVVKRGETTQLCYGVVNAKSVKIDPPVEPIKPSYRHCMDISPNQTTTYTITADDGAGHTKSASLTVHVK